MTVSIEKTAKKYFGKKASSYETIRKKQIRWDLENKAVGAMLSAAKPKTVLDVPVGTGRFFSHYEHLGVRGTGIDISQAMLDLAALKKKRDGRPNITLQLGDAQKTGFKDASFDCSVCVRFLDLIDEKAMQTVVRELGRVTKKTIIATIRLGDTYVPKSNTAEHDSKKFRRLVDNMGWKITEEVPIFKAGWVVLKMERK